MSQNHAANGTAWSRGWELGNATPIQLPIPDRLRHMRGLYVLGMPQNIETAPPAECDASSALTAAVAPRHPLDAVHQRPGNPPPVTLDHLFAAEASATAIAGPAARAGVHRRKQLEPRGKALGPCRAADHGHPGFDRLAHDLQCVPAPLGHLVFVNRSWRCCHVSVGGALAMQLGPADAGQNSVKTSNTQGVAPDRRGSAFSGNCLPCRLSET